MRYSGGINRYTRKVRLRATWDGAELFRAEDSYLNENNKVLLKQYRFLLESDEQKDFLDTARAIENLSSGSEHISDIVDYGVDGEVPFLVMPYVRSSTLAEKYAGKRLSPNVVLRYLKQIKDILEYAYEADMYYHNICPEHIDVISREQEEDVQLTTDTAGEELRLLHFKLGKPTSETYDTRMYPWLAPEQFPTSESEPIGPKADQYALAVLVHYLMTGHVPLKGDDQSGEAIQRARLWGTPFLWKEKLSRPMQEVLLKAMARKQEKRYKNLTEFVQAFEAACQTPVEEATVVPMTRRELMGLIGSGIVASILFTVFAAERIMDDPVPTPKPVISVSQFPQHQNEVTVVAWSADGNSIASGDLSGIIYVWDPFTGQSKQECILHEGAEIVSIAWGPFSRYIASADKAGNIYIWDPTTGNPINKGMSINIYDLSQGNGAIQMMGWSANLGEHLVFNIGDNALVYDYPVDHGFTLLDAPPYSGHSGTITCIAFQPLTTQVVTGSADTTARIWIAEDQKGQHPTLFTYGGHKSEVKAVSWRQDGKVIASGGGDRSVQVWYSGARGTQAGTPLFPPYYHNEAVNSVAFSPFGQYIASASDDKTVQVRDMDGKLAYPPYTGHSGSVTSIAWSPLCQGQCLYIASASSDKTVHVWMLNQGWNKSRQ